jgi:FkbM family methyltransferase
MKNQIFSCPRECLPGIGEVWSDALPVRLEFGSPLVLDIGANVGAFTLWALRQWPGCRVTAYEPHPYLFGFLEQNTAGLPVECIRAAVGDSQFGTLRPGNNSLLCNSQYDLGRQGNPSIPVQVIPPEALPPAEIVKVDTEGAERFIVENLKHLPALLLVEFHTEANRIAVERALCGRMTPVQYRLLQPGYGHIVYLRPAK